MNADRLAQIEKAAQAAWAMANDSASIVTGVSLRVTEGVAIYEVVLDKHYDLTCKRMK